MHRDRNYLTAQMAARYIDESRRSVAIAQTRAERTKGKDREAWLAWAGAFARWLERLLAKMPSLAYQERASLANGGPVL